MKEKQIEAYLVKRIKELGGIAYKFSSPAKKGVPDRLCLLPGGLMFFVECKAKGKKPTKLQRAELDKIDSLGHEIYVVDSKESINDLFLSYKIKLEGKK